MEKLKVSVIIPIYNAGCRLKPCVDSLVNQTLKDVELIFVLDCPTDGSDSLIVEYAKNSDNIVVVVNEHNLNIGLSRNEGLKVARGEYVAFCDHDDVVMEYMYEDMYRTAKKYDADIVLGVPEYSYPDSSKNEIYYYPRGGDVKDILLPLIIGKDETKKGWEFYFSHGVIWDNLYRLDFLKKNKIYFVDNNKITFEDNLFLIEALIYANKAIVYNKLVYIHTIEDTNTAASASYHNTRKVLEYLIYLQQLLNDNNLFDKYKRNYNNSLVSYIKDCIRCSKGFQKYYTCTEISNNLQIKKLLRDIKCINYIKDAKNNFASLFHAITYCFISI